MAIDAKKPTLPADGAPPTDEPAPSYEATMAASAPPQGHASSSSSAAPGHTLPHASIGYGSVPYAASHTARVIIMPPGAVPGRGPAGGLVASGPPRRQPRAGRRFLAAFFWALLIWILLNLVAAAIVDAAERAQRDHRSHGKHGAHSQVLLLRVGQGAKDWWIGQR